MKLLYSTPKARRTASCFRKGKGYPVETWFHLELHEGPPDTSTYEGCGQTVAYWRDQFTRLRYPRDVRFSCHGARDDVPAAVHPMDILDSLPNDARTSFGWTVCPVKD